MAPVKSVPFRIVTKPRTVQVGGRVEYEENTVSYYIYQKIEFLLAILWQL